MSRKTSREIDKGSKPISGTEEPMYEGEEAWGNFEKLARKVFINRDSYIEFEK